METSIFLYWSLLDFDVRVGVVERDQEFRHRDTKMVPEMMEAMERRPVVQEGKPPHHCRQCNGNHPIGTAAVRVAEYFPSPLQRNTHELCPSFVFSRDLFRRASMDRANKSVYPSPAQFPGSG
jgi:hypothetical protein